MCYTGSTKDKKGENTVNFEKLICEIIEKPGLTTIWARPRYGMTTLFVQFVDNLVKASGKTGCVFLLECSKEYFLNKWKTIGLDCSKIVVNDKSEISADTIRKIVKKMNGRCVIAIDYYQLLDDSLAMELKNLALELSVSIFVKGVLSRCAEDNPEGKATLYDLQERKSLLYGKEPFAVQDSDIIMFLWRPHKCDRGIGTAYAYDFENKSEIIIAKNHWGKLGTIHTEWDEEKLCFKL